MFKNISTTLIVMIIAMLSSFAVTIIFGRVLSTGDFGEFTLLKQIVLIGSTVAIFGLDFSYIKVFTKNPDANRRTHIITLGVFLSISVLFIYIIKEAYDYPISKLVYILFCVWFGAINLYLAAIHRLKRRFMIAQVFAGGWKILLLMLIGIILYLGISIDINIIYQIFLISLFIFSTFIIKYLHKINPITESSIDYNNYLSLGLIFWMINSAGLVSGGIDKLIIPLIFDNEVLGIFAAISFIFTVSMTMIGSAIGYVLFPRLSAGEIIDYRSISVFIVTITLLALLLFHLFGIEIVSLVFSQKYDEFINTTLIYCFTIMGSLQIVHTVLHFMISARGNKNQLITYWVLTIISIIIFVILLYLFRTTSTSILIMLSMVIITTRILKISFMAVLLKSIEKQGGECNEQLPHTA